MGVCESDVPGWIELDWDDPESGHRDVWDRFYEQFVFRPSVEPSDWPGIVEPVNSLTFSIGRIYDPEKYQLWSEELTAWAAKMLQDLAGSGWIYALNWHHCCYRFFPAAPFSIPDPDAWPVPILPNGDYYAFLSRGFSFGFFGHPWERTMCFWGDPLLPHFERALPAALYGPVRAGGQRTAMPWEPPERP